MGVRIGQFDPEINFRKCEIWAKVSETLSQVQVSLARLPFSLARSCPQVIRVSLFFWLKTSQKGGSHSPDA
jgi:hypothetical protein